MRTRFEHLNGETRFDCMEDFRDWQCYLGGSPIGLDESYMAFAVGLDGRHGMSGRRFPGFRLLEDLKRLPMPSLDIGASGETPENVTFREQAIAELQALGIKVIKRMFPFNISAHAGNSRRKTGFVVQVANDHNFSDSLNVLGVPNRGDTSGDLVLIVYAEDDATIETFPTSGVIKFGVVVVCNPNYSDGTDYTPRQSRSFPSVVNKDALLDIINNGWRYTQDSLVNWVGSGENWIPLLTRSTITAWHNERFIYIGSQDGEWNPITVWCDPSLRNNQDSERSPGWFFDPMGPGIDVPARVDTFIASPAKNADPDNLPPGELTIARPAQYDDQNFTVGGTEHVATNNPLYFWLGFTKKQTPAIQTVAPSTTQAEGTAVGGVQEFRIRLMDYYRGRYSPLSLGGRRTLSLNKSAVVVHREYDGQGTRKYYNNTAIPIPSIFYDVESILSYKHAEIYATLSLDNSLTSLDLPNGSLGAFRKVDTILTKNFNIEKDKAKYLTRFAQAFPQFYAPDGTYSATGYQENRWPVVALLMNYVSRGSAYQNGVQSPIPTGWDVPNFRTDFGDSSFRWYMRHNPSYVGSPSAGFDAWSDYYGIFASPISDNEIAANQVYDHARDECGIPPQRVLAGAALGSTNFIATDRQATPIILDSGDIIQESPDMGHVVIVHSPTHASFPENFPTLNRYVTKIPVGSPVTFVKAGDALFLVGSTSVVRILKGNGAVYFYEYATSGALLSEFATAQFKDGAILGLKDGFYLLNPQVAALQPLMQLDRITNDLWRGALDTVSMAYDQILDAVFIHHAASATTAVLWREEQRVTLLEDMVYNQVAPLMVNGSQRAVFVSDTGRFVYPRDDSDDGLDLDPEIRRPLTTAGFEPGVDPETIFTVSDVMVVAGDTRLTVPNARRVFGPDKAANAYYPNGTLYWRGHKIYTLGNGVGYRIWSTQSHPQFGGPAQDNEVYIFIRGDVSASIKAGDTIGFSPVPLKIVLSSIPSAEQENSGSQRRMVNFAHANVQWFRTNPNLGVPLFQAGIVDYATLRKGEPFKHLDKEVLDNDQIAGWARLAPTFADLPGLFSTPLPNQDRSVTIEVLNPATVSGYFAGSGHIVFPWVSCVIPGLEIELHSLVFRGTISASEFQQSVAES